MSSNNCKFAKPKEHDMHNHQSTAGKIHTEAVAELMSICEQHGEVRQLLEHAIRQAAAINPDRRYNPAQTLFEFYDFIDRNIRLLPWEVMLNPSPTQYGSSLYGRADQGIGYFWFIVDQPLEELRDCGFYYPTIEYVEPFASWLTTYADSWGSWLSTEESWNNDYYTLVASDPDWGLSRGWYGIGNQWHTFNDFFSRRLAGSEVRPISDAAVVSPVDACPKELFAIDENNQLLYPDDLQIKTAKLSDISQLIGRDSMFCDAFAGGTLTHTILDINDYHRYHAPVDGVLRELRTIAGVAAGGGYTMWDNEQKLYYYTNETGFQMLETRACAIIETARFGLVAMLPVGMSQICSCNWLPTLHIGQTLYKGDEMGYFLFGGSDIVLIFQKGVKVTPLHSGKHLLMGEGFAELHKA